MARGRNPFPKPKMSAGSLRLWTGMNADKDSHGTLMPAQPMRCLGITDLAVAQKIVGRQTSGRIPALGVCSGKPVWDAPSRTWWMLTDF